MARIPEELIRSVLDTVDVVDVISQYVTLKRSGRSFKGLCPFHEEKTPSFHVFPESGNFKCFGCGEGGDALAFLMRRNNTQFRETLEEMARAAGIAIEEAEPDPREAEREQSRQGALRALDFAAGFFRAVLKRETGRPAREYLARRGFDEALCDAFGLGFAPDDYEGLLETARARGVPPDALLQAGLARRNDQGRWYDFFRGRLMFPIHDLAGRVVGFGGRALGDEQPKYINSPDSPLFRKGREMYGLNLAREASRRQGRLVVVEGYTDVMACHQAGMAEVAAGLGTALTPDNARQLRRLRQPVLLLYDGDEAGQRAAERAGEVLLAEGVEGAVALLPPGRDPADLIADEGIEALEAALGRASDLWGYRLGRALERHDATLEGNAKVVAELLPAVGKIHDPVRRDLAFKLLSEKTGVNESTLRNQIRPGNVQKGSEEGPTVPGGWLRAERDFLWAGMEDSDLWDRIAAEYPPDAFKEPDLRVVATAIHDLRRNGESVTREGLLGVLADRDSAVRALQALEGAEGACERAVRHLERLARDSRVRTAVNQADLEAAVLARGGSIERERTS